MLRRISALLVILVLLTGTLFASGQAEAAGAVDIDDSDWDALIAAAQEEGKVTVYATTSRIHPATEAFQEKYGITVDAHRLSEVELIERVYQEAQSGVDAVDVVLIEDFPSMKELLIDTGHLENYIPPTAREKIPSEYHDPLVFAWVNRVIGYNTEAFDEDPFESIWDVTLPEWEGRVMIRDLAITGEHQNAFTELMRRSDELEAEYERRFGEPLEMEEDNAGLEFLRRLATNDPILMTSDTRISEAVGKRGQDEPPAGFFYVYSKHRDIPRKDLALDFSHNIKPLLGYYYGLYVQLASNPQNPNAARLLADYLLTEDGFSPWADDVGIYSMNQDISHHEDDMSWEWWSERLWTYDPQYAAENRGTVLDAWLGYVQ